MSAEPEIVKDIVEDTVKDDNENVAAVSADEVKPSEDDSASAVDAKQQAVADESEADSTKKI